jgi:hypothetical protein
MAHVTAESLEVQRATFPGASTAMAAQAGVYNNSSAHCGGQAQAHPPAEQTQHDKQTSSC